MKIKVFSPLPKVNLSQIGRAFPSIAWSFVTKMLSSLIAMTIVGLAFFNILTFGRHFYPDYFASWWASPAPQASDTAESEQLTATLSANLVVNQATISAKPKKVVAPVDPYANDPALKDAAWGQAVQVSETGYRMKIQMDERMSTPEELFTALNVYRNTKGKSTLTWDQKLADYAAERAEYVCINGSDGHAGFKDYLEQQDGFAKLGFNHVGENMSTGYRLSGVHLIEFMYAGDPPHDNNQLGDWSHVGTGIYDDCSALIFGTGKM